MLMPLSTIVFPHLNPVIIRLGPVAVRWYGVAYLMGFLAAYVCLRRMAKRGILRLTTDDLGDLLTWLILGVVAGGRIGWWLFYHRGGGASERWYEPLAIWHGGMSFHGGLVGVGVVLVLWSWRHQAPLWNLADATALVAPIGLFFGRLANFVNAELVGRPTSMPWGIIFPGETFARHPSQLYEAILEGPLLLLLLWTFFRGRHREGRTAALLVILYGSFRFCVEFTREPDGQLGFIAFGWLTMGQLLSAAMSAIGVGLWLLAPRFSSAFSGSPEPTLPPSRLGNSLS
jgi:phosphatidylglycerol:prolipoprotein diacylglycerol transferase